MTERSSSALAEFNFLESLLDRCPNYVPLLKAMGELYTEKGQIDKGLAIDLHLVALIPDDDESWYNLGCSYALVENVQDAFAALKEAIRLGYDSFDWMQTDDDLQNLHRFPEWDVLLHSIKKI